MNRFARPILNDDHEDHVSLIVSDEGVIVDAFRDDEIAGTWAKTWDELFDFITEEDCDGY